MPLIGLVDTTDGANKNLEAALGLSSVATPTVPPTFEPAVVRGALAVVPGALPSTPTIGTLAIDSTDSNMLKWWNGTAWIACATAGSGGGGGGSGIGVGQTISLQQGLDTNVTIAVSGTLVSMVANDPLPDGLTLNETTGRITGIPTVFGLITVNLTATFTDAVTSGDVDLNIAEAFAITFTFSETPAAIPEGEYTSLPLTYTPFPNALPATWNVSGFPSGMWWYEDSSSHQVQLYGTPKENGTFSVTVAATNWTGTTTTTFPLTVYAYNMQISGSSGGSGTYDGLYEPVAIGYYTGEGTPTEVIGIPNGWNDARLRIYQHETNANYKLFYYENYGCWVLADITMFTGAPPFQSAVRFLYANSEALPPTDPSAWFPTTLMCQWIAPPAGGGGDGFNYNPTWSNAAWSKTSGTYESGSIQPNQMSSLEWIGTTTAVSFGWSVGDIGADTFRFTINGSDALYVSAPDSGVYSETGVNVPEFDGVTLITLRWEYEKANGGSTDPATKATFYSLAILP